jgi:hypothetical protein
MFTPRHCLFAINNSSPIPGTRVFAHAKGLRQYVWVWKAGTKKCQYSPADLHVVSKLIEIAAEDNGHNDDYADGPDASCEFNLARMHGPAGPAIVTDFERQHVAGCTHILSVAGAAG